MAIERILCAVDGTAASRRASEVALDLAQPADAEVIFLYASAEDMDRLNIEEPFTTGADEKLAAEVPVLGEASRLAADRGVRATLHLVGDAAGPAVISSIVATAHSRDAGLIVVGSRELRGVQKALLGSVSEGVVHEANVPTVIVHPPHYS